MLKQKITIIGAGLSGLVTAKTLLEYGYEVQVFEKENEIGGVWASCRHYPGLTTQNTRDTYAFSDFPMPGHYPEFPTGTQMLEYLKNYAITFGLTKYISTCHEVLSADLNYNTDSDKHYWQLKIKSLAEEPFTVITDYLIVCNGTFSTPFIPDAPGIVKFINNFGRISHSSNLKETESLTGKKVVVVGYGKSACDLAVAVAENAAEITLLYRQAKWKVPKKIRGINYKYIVLSRFGEALTKLKYRNRLEKFIHFMRFPSFAFGTMQKIFTRQQKLKEVTLVPSASITDLVFGELSVESDGFFKQVLAGKIKPVKAEISTYTETGIILSNGESIVVDIVVYGTGFSQELPFIDELLKSRFTDDKGNYLLHRNILPLNVPALAFNGYNSSFFCNLTSEIAALWIAEYLSGNINLPATKEMESKINEHLLWRQQYSTKALFRNATVWPFNLTYVDWLLKDMNAKLSIGKLFSEWLKVVNPSNYAGLKKKIMNRNFKKKNNKGTLFTID